MLDFVKLFNNIPPELATILTGMTPIGELRAALPIALTVYGFPLWKAFLLSVIGNMIPVVFILWLLEPVSKFLMERSKIMNRFFSWLFKRTHKKGKKGFEKWGALVLVIFVAIPLPLTGAWSGAVAAFVFGIPYKKALSLILLGVLIAGVIVSIMTVGISSFL